MVIEINKDIDHYQETLALGLNARQLLFSMASVVVGGGIVLLLYRHIGLTGSAYVAIPCVAPIALGGFYSYNGMDFYEYMGRKLHFMFSNQTLLYVSTEGEPAVRKLQADMAGQEKQADRTGKEGHAGETEKSEAFEAAKKKLRRFVITALFVSAAVIAGAAAYKFLH